MTLQGLLQDPSLAGAIRGLIQDNLRLAVRAHDILLERLEQEPAHQPAKRSIDLEELWRSALEIEEGGSSRSEQPPRLLEGSLRLSVLVFT